jgi:hypothetical protein
MIRQLIKKGLRSRGLSIVRVYRSDVSQASIERLRAAGARATPEGLKLHVGCGPRVLKGWLNIDLAWCDDPRYTTPYGEAYSAEVRGTRDDFFAFDVAGMPLPLPDNSVRVVFNEDFIEHLDQRQQVLFLAETWRVLKPGGVHRINTPDLLKSMRQHSDFTRGYAGVFQDEWRVHGHLNVLTPAVLAEMARMVGYSDIHFGSKGKSISAEVPPEYRPGADRPVDGNVFADLVK